MGLQMSVFDTWHVLVAQVRSRRLTEAAWRQLASASSPLPASCVLPFPLESQLQTCCPETLLASRKHTIPAGLRINTNHRYNSHTLQSRWKESAADLSGCELAVKTFSCPILAFKWDNPASTWFSLEQLCYIPCLFVLFWFFFSELWWMHYMEDFCVNSTLNNIILSMMMITTNILIAYLGFKEVFGPHHSFCGHVDLRQPGQSHQTALLLQLSGCSSPENQQELQKKKKVKSEWLPLRQGRNQVANLIRYKNPLASLAVWSFSALYFSFRHIFKSPPQISKVGQCFQTWNELTRCCIGMKYSSL